VSVKKQLYTMQQKEKAPSVTGYALSRAWFDFAFENGSIVRPVHGVIYFWTIELANRMGWPKEFANPTSQAMAACGIQSYNTYKAAFTDLVKWGFISLLKASTNQHQSCIIALSKFNKPTNRSLDKSLTEHLTNQVHITDSIIKPLTKEPKTLNILFSVFWDAYKWKKGKKSEAERLWDKLKDTERQAIMNGIDVYEKSFEKKKYQPYPTTFLNGRLWENEDYGSPQTTTTTTQNNVQPKTSLTKEEFRALMES
jgi:hypothetical protein